MNFNVKREGGEEKTGVRKGNGKLKWIGYLGDLFWRGR